MQKTTSTGDARAIDWLAARICQMEKRLGRYVPPLAVASYCLVNGPPLNPKAPEFFPMQESAPEQVLEYLGLDRDSHKQKKNKEYGPPTTLDQLIPEDVQNIYIQPESVESKLRNAPDNMSPGPDENELENAENLELGHKDWEQVHDDGWQENSEGLTEQNDDLGVQEDWILRPSQNDSEQVSPDFDDSKYPEKRPTNLEQEIEDDRTKNFKQGRETPELARNDDKQEYAHSNQKRERVALDLFQRLLNDDSEMREHWCSFREEFGDLEPTDTPESIFVINFLAESKRKRRAGLPPDAKEGQDDRTNSLTNYLKQALENLEQRQDYPKQAQGYKEHVHDDRMQDNFEGTTGLHDDPGMQDNWTKDPKQGRKNPELAQHDFEQALGSLEQTQDTPMQDPCEQGNQDSQEETTDVQPARKAKRKRRQKANSKRGPEEVKQDHEEEPDEADVDKETEGAGAIDNYTASVQSMRDLMSEYGKTGKDPRQAITETWLQSGSQRSRFLEEYGPLLPAGLRLEDT